MARRATEIKKARSSTQSFLLVDAGNSLSNEFTTAAETAAANNGQTAVQVIEKLGYDAVALGDLDLAMGRAELQKRIAEATSVPFVSANVADKATGQLLVKPYVIKDVGSHRVALIGITGTPKTVVPSQAGDFTVAPALDAAREYVPKAQSEAEIIILLSNAGAETNKTIASQVPGIDVIVSGGQDPLTSAMQPVPGTVLVQADQSSLGHAGRYIGRLQVTFDPGGKITGHNWQSIELGPGVADDGDMAAWVGTLPTPAPAASPTPTPQQ